MEQNNLPGHLILLTAPSGSGKKKMIECLESFKDQLHLAKTFTSRQPRANSPESPLYNFISRDEFERLIKEDEFVEWAEFSSNLYGTPKSEVFGPMERGEVVFKEMELQGVEKMREAISKENLTVIYIDAGPWEDLRERILSRNPMSEDRLEQRRERYEIEKASMGKADIVIENFNGKLEEAQENFRQAMSDILFRVKN